MVRVLRGFLYIVVWLFRALTFCDVDLAVGVRFALRALATVRFACVWFVLDVVCLWICCGILYILVCFLYLFLFRMLDA